MLSAVSNQNHTQRQGSVDSRSEILRLYPRAVCAAAIGTGLLRWRRRPGPCVRVRIETELTKQLKLCKHVAFQIHVEKAREDIRIALDQLEVLAV